MCENNTKVFWRNGLRTYPLSVCAVYCGAMTLLGTSGSASTQNVLFNGQTLQLCRRSQIAGTLCENHAHLLMKTQTSGTVDTSRNSLSSDRVECPTSRVIGGTRINH